MEKGILNSSSLQKNIDYLNFYIDEEFKILNNIYKKLLECGNYYCSSNSTLFLEDINTFPNNIKLIKENRIKYVKNLTNVIIKYDTLTKRTKQIFNYGDDFGE